MGKKKVKYLLKDGRWSTKFDLWNIAVPSGMSNSQSAIRRRGFSVGIDENGIFIFTHRCRSKSYPSYRKIPKKVKDFIKSTG